MHSALGIRVHSGWSAVVAVCGAPDSVQLIDRRRIDCVDPSAPGVKQPYHFVEAMDLPAAEKHLARCRESSIRMATQALSDAVRQLDERGFQVVGAAILEASGRTLEMEEVARVDLKVDLAGRRHESLAVEALELLRWLEAPPNGGVKNDLLKAKLQGLSGHAAATTEQR